MVSLFKSVPQLVSRTQTRTLRELWHDKRIAWELDGPGVFEAYSGLLALQQYGIKESFYFFVHTLCKLLASDDDGNVQLVNLLVSPRFYHRQKNPALTIRSTTGSMEAKCHAATRCGY